MQRKNMLTSLVKAPVHGGSRAPHRLFQNRIAVPEATRPQGRKGAAGPFCRKPARLPTSLCPASGRTDTPLSAGLPLLPPEKPHLWQADQATVGRHGGKRYASLHAPAYEPSGCHTAKSALHMAKPS